MLEKREKKNNDWVLYVLVYAHFCRRCGTRAWFIQDSERCARRFLGGQSTTKRAYVRTYRTVLVHIKEAIPITVLLHT